MSEQPGTERWTIVGTAKELRRKRAIVVAGPEADVAVFWNDGQPSALANICIHRKRELSRGAILDGRVVCPGHQWAFDVTTGYCAEREQSQPTFETRIIDDVVVVDASTTINGVQVTPRDADDASDEVPSSDRPLVADAGNILPTTIGPYSPSIATGELVFLSGQVGKLPGTTRVEGSVAQQTTACLRNLGVVLKANGLDYASLVKCNVYLIDLDDFAEMNDAYEAELAPCRPARTTVGVAALPLGARVEIEAVAQNPTASRTA